MNTAEPKSVKNRARRERRAKERFDAALKTVMSTPEGRSFMVWLLGEAGIHRTSFRNNALEMAFVEGQRNIGLKAEAELLTVCPDLYAAALDESKKFLKREDDAESALEPDPEKEDDNG